MSLSRDWQCFSVKGWIMNILGFVCYTISLTPLSHLLSPSLHFSSLSLQEPSKNIFLAWW